MKKQADFCIVMITPLLRILFALCLLSESTYTSSQTRSQDSLKKEEFIPHGRLSGSFFGDYAFKTHADTVNGGRGSNQYSGIPKNRSMFQYRRVYIGYNYDISPKFSAELLLASEDDIPGGDVLGDNKLAPFIKLANVRWKNVWKGTDIVFGQASSPAYSLLTEKIWGYRSVERTVSDFRRTPSYDLGITIQGHFIATNDNYGYNLMAGNGQGAKPENDLYKWLYADVYAKFFEKKLIADLYVDYNRMHWNSNWHHSRNMFKGFLAYTVPRFTVGIEAFINTLKGDNIATASNGTKDTIATKAKAISVFVHGKLYKDKLGFFGRYDTYDPSGNTNNNKYINYSPQTLQYDPATGEHFITAGLDYAPDKNVHILPNIWYTAYNNKGPKNFGSANTDHDLVFRLTVQWIIAPAK